MYFMTCPSFESIIGRDGEAYLMFHKRSRSPGHIVRLSLVIYMTEFDESV